MSQVHLVPSASLSLAVGITLSPSPATTSSPEPPPLQVIPTKDGLLLTQHKYIRDLLAKSSMDGARDITTPLSTSAPLKLTDGSSVVDSTEYCRVIGALQYMSLTRPDISFVINKLSQFMISPTQNH
ncbi:hypothetical protein SADUNF_Sadunf18G0070500 [Salix dunnii]|uniref:Reverse transcriptase Ty1/copia-type domain-containing protein n=1 Tax=Salix dunnii TaxID=1413687 RepID=A0A835J337_9ROSI|nr:hypothetical protein SADUNF_Sadunf18G0070500 [Salix dunnii]